MKRYGCTVFRRGQEEQLSLGFTGLECIDFCKFEVSALRKGEVDIFIERDKKIYDARVRTNAPVIIYVILTPWYFITNLLRWSSSHPIPSHQSIVNSSPQEGKRRERGVPEIPRTSGMLLAEVRLGAALYSTLLALQMSPQVRVCLGKGVKSCSVGRSVDKWVDDGAILGM